MSQNIPTPSPNYTGPVVVDPVTRLEGHLRMEVDVTQGNISNAFSSMTLFRGLELILQGRDPQDAQHITQRACGVCTFTHALAATRCVEDAVGVKIPTAANQIRNLVLATHFMHDHIVHFYQLNALDYVNVANCLNADPAAAAKIANSISKRETKVEDLKAVQDRVKKLVGSGQLGPFTNAYFLGGHPAYLLTPELDLLATAHYLEALRLQTRTARACAVFGAKHPHPQFTVVGGVTCYESLRPERIAEFEELVKETVDFVNNCYLPDVLAIGDVYRNVTTYGGSDNFVCGPEFMSDPADVESGKVFGVVIKNKDLSKPESFVTEKITEHVRHSWYEGADAPHPYEGKTEPKFTDLHGDDRYSWGKAPRYDDLPAETGPLATVLGQYARNNKPFVDTVNYVLETLGVGPEALFSTLGRTAARCIETVVYADMLVKEGGLLDEFKETVNKADGKPKLVEKWEMPNTGKGVGVANVSRGMLSHFIRIENRKIANYQLVVPTTWSLSPRCANGHLGPVETALIGAPLADASRPVEILRTIHSFDPCIACAVHVTDVESKEETVYKVL